MVGTIKSVISIVVIGIFHVFFEAQLNIAGVSQTSQIMEKIDVVFVKVVGPFQKLDH